MNLSTIKAYLQLMRPANIITAWADVLCGFATTGLVYIWLQPNNTQFGFFNYDQLLLLIIATTGLYGGGVVFNDVFDAELDKKERPERPIPSGRASLKGAIILGIALLLVGILAAYLASPLSSQIAILIAIAALVYDKWGKHNHLLGPVNMGLCRGLNLLLGMSPALEAAYYYWYLAFIPIIFISAITMISRSEVKGGDKKVLATGGVLFLIVGCFIASLSIFSEHKVLNSLPFLILFLYMIYKPLIKAYKNPIPPNIKASVRGGILALIPMDAAIASGYAGWVYGVLILALLPLSLFLAKKFAVT